MRLVEQERLGVSLAAGGVGVGARGDDGRFGRGRYVLAPPDRAADRSWVSAVVAIGSYRVDHDVTDR